MMPNIVKDKFDNILNSFVNALDAGLAVLDKDLNIIWANERLSEILNLRYVPVGKNCRDVYKCECKDTTNCSTFQALSSGKNHISEIQYITEKGERRYIENITTLIKDEKDTITYLFKISLDVTSREEKYKQVSLLLNLT